MPFDHFDFLAPIYDQAIRIKNPERWLKIALLPTSGTLLDVGGGTGRISAILSQYARQTVVADLSFGMLRQASSKKDLERVCTPSELLPFDDGAFERVIMVDAFHHIKDPKQTAGELWRVLKSGGRLVIEEPDVRTPVIKVVALAEKLALMRSHFITPPRILGFFRYPNARAALFRESYNTWIIIEKVTQNL